MTKTFDESVEQAWARFEVGLRRHAGARAGVPLTVRAESGGGREPYLRLARLGDEIALEVGTDALLGDDTGPDDTGPDDTGPDDTGPGAAQRAALQALGWSAPDGVDRPTWWCDGPVAEAEALVAMVVGTLRHVFDVVDPGFLEVEPVLAPGSLAPTDPSQDDRDDRDDDDQDDDDQSDDDLVLGFPTTTEEIAGLLVRVMRSTYGDDIARDQDGDFPVWTGTVPVWITPLGERRVLRFFSHVVVEVADLPAARREIEVLNRQTPLLKFHLAGDVVIASYELPCHPFIGPTVMGTLESVAETLDDLATDLALRLGGSMFFDGVHPVTDDDERA